jgi:hypothetical protein
MVLQQHFDEVSGSCERHGIPVTVVDYSELMADAESVVAVCRNFWVVACRRTGWLEWLTRRSIVNA